MPIMLIYDRVKAEVDLIRDQMSLIEEDNYAFSIHKAETLQELIVRVSELETVSLYCSDFDAGGEKAVRLVKDRNPKSSVVVIVDRETSPVQYVRPSIEARGLILRPISKNQVAGILQEVVDDLKAREREQIFNNEIFTFQTRDGTIRVPYSKILYFEARNKKIVVCTGRTETEFYSTLDSLQTQVPDYFIRCHKGYIINKLLVSLVKLGQNEVQLLGGFNIPVSRSYKALVKEVLT